MAADMQRWAIVLGAGDGTRLQSLTRHAGVPVPKQYCTLNGKQSLFQLALDRAERVVAPASIVTVVAAGHQQWWSRDLARLRPRSVVVQPENRGTAAGVLLPLLEVQRRDPRGRVVLLPSDHWIDAEWILADAIGSAFELLEHDPRRILLLGMTPDQPETGYGWIVPGHEREPAGEVFLHDVRAFVEKPPIEQATGLMADGGLWNSFILVATVPALMDLYARRLPTLLCAMATVGDEWAPANLAELYAGLGQNDFSRDLLQGAEADLGVVHVPACGWTDLGTPRRVADCLRRSAVHASGDPDSDRVNLAYVLANGA